jgi:hypothetical protein
MTGDDNASDAMTTECCPACSYRLNGLPLVHTCPECGFDYDPHAEVIELTADRRHWRQVVFGLLLVIMFAAYGTVFEDRLILAGLIILILWHLAQGFRRHSQGYRVLMNRRGVEIRFPPNSPISLSWDQFEIARFNWLTGRFKLKDLAGNTIHALRFRDIGSIQLGRRLTRKLNDLKSIYKTGAK